MFRVNVFVLSVFVAIFCVAGVSVSGAEGLRHGITNDRPSDTWRSAPPLGNGVLGATLYGLTEVAAGPVVAAGVKDGNWTLKSFFKDGVHPSDIGHALYAKVLSEKLVPCLDLPAPDKTPKLPSLMGQGKLESAQLETIVPIGASNGWERKDKQWNWWEVPIWEAKQEKAPLSFKITGKKPQLIFEGKLQVTWTAGGTKKVKIIQGHTSPMPMPASWHFPVEALPEAPVTVEAVAGNSGKIKGQVWGIFSIQAPK